MIDPAFRNINRLFSLSFKNGISDPTRDSFNKYYMPLVEIKDFNALIGNKTFFNEPVKSNQKVDEKLIEMSRSGDYTTGNFGIFKIIMNSLVLIYLDKQIHVSLNKLIL